ncbi:MAG TPA: hypothetical protein VKQ32_23450 [Polyangia bacterium]|nr:hypothetical protein [Polyangia bacterium]
MSRYTATEGRELTRRLAKTPETGGVPHADVVRETREDMKKELRQMVRAYKGTPRQAKELLEALAVPEAARSLEDAGGSRDCLRATAA